MNIKAILGIMSAYFLWKMTTHPPKVWKILYLFFTPSLAHNENEIEAMSLIEKYKNWNKHLFFIQSLLSFHFSCFLVRSFFLTDLQPASRKWLEWKWEGQREGGKNLNFELKTSGGKCLLRTGKQEQKGLKQGAYDYYCYSSAKKLSKTKTFSDKKWSNVSYKACVYNPRRSLNYKSILST